MHIKQILKRIMSMCFELMIKHHKTSASKVPPEDARRIIGDVYQPIKYECTGRVSEEIEYEISFIVPVYNGEKYLEKCIESLVNQKTERKYELIFINDGSRDSSMDILNKYESLPNVVVLSQENSGISRTRNKGIEISRGKYIGFVDNDDYVSEDYVEKMMSLADRLQADVIKCGCVEFDSDTGKLLHDFGTHEDATYENGLGKDLLKYDGFIWGGCYRKDFWGSTIFPKDYWYEDMITRFLPYRRAKTFGYIGESMYYKREHATNSAKKIWVSGNVKSLDQYYLTKELIRMNEELGLPKDEVLFRLIVSEFGFMLGHRTKHLEDNIREAIFVMASEELKNFPESYDFDDLFCKSLRKKDYKLWKLATSLRETRY
ncbi:Glycosyltransferase involved in cell wall bisynthesis [Lachnospiraceae bacterium YSD2013]|nr:Glycosyltransferase involved in cell wall bisynthesis [Lachnospiraceae bacterium YSD2013]